MIVDLIEGMGNWSWMLLGLILLAIEVMLPGFFFLWFSIAALIVGASAFLIDWPWQFQVIGFVVLAVASAYAGRKLMGTKDTPTEDPNLNLRATRLEGRTFTLHEPIKNGSGRIKVDDSVWRIQGPDLAAGKSVVVVGSDGATLRVEAAGEAAAA